MWPTPTPFPTAAAPATLPFDGSQVIADFSGNIIQGWNWFNTSPISTVLFIGLLLALVFVGFMSIRAHLESL